jgi:hydroxypyruvate reductase
VVPHEIALHPIEVFEAVLRRLDPERLTEQALRRRAPGPTQVVALGKAAPAMARGAAAALGARLVGGLVVTDHREPLPPGFDLVLGSHPVPDSHSVAAGERLLEFVATGRPEHRLVVLLSGGGSAIAEVPLPGLEIGDIADLVGMLAQTGAPIGELNTVRRHLSRLKNGGLAAHAAAGGLLTLALSDVAGGPASDIASGPTGSDGSTPESALIVLQRRLGTVPPAIGGALSRAAAEPAPNAGGEFEVLADSAALARAAAEELDLRGARAGIWTTSLGGEASIRAREMIAAAPEGLWFLATGESTVSGAGSVPGGRNQEAALAAAVAIEGHPTVFAAFATDGVDGTTDAAGSVVGATTATTIRQTGHDPDGLLAAHRAHEALGAARALVHTGPTGNNLGDLWMVWKSRQWRGSRQE